MTQAATTAIASNHWGSLTEGSDILPEVIEERGYYTVTDTGQLTALGFKGYQRNVPALVIPIWGVDGGLKLHRTRPDNPRRGKKKKKEEEKDIKYEQPENQPLALDVPRRCQPHLSDTSRRLWIVEGEKKADSLASRGEIVIGLLGVWGWKRDGYPLPEWDGVYLIDREVFIAFDSDATNKSEVRRARSGLCKYLNARGAK